MAAGPRTVLEGNEPEVKPAGHMMHDIAPDWVLYPLAVRLRPTSHAAPHKLNTLSPSAPTQAELAGWAAATPHGVIFTTVVCLVAGVEWS